MTTATFTADDGGSAQLDSSRLLVEVETGKLYTKSASYGSGPLTLTPVGSTAQTAAEAQISGLTSLISSAQGIS
jgi:hypothetical protein